MGALPDGHLLRAEGLGKMYRIYERPQDRLKHSLLWRFGREYGRVFWALNDVSFEIDPGRATGVIGRNGSGKSTLLQLLAGTLAPTEGRIVSKGRIAGLLELGSGFNPEFTGRENALLNAAILGLDRAEMESRLPEVAAFAEIGDFLDQPVKMYSSGMFLRLAFSVATMVDADVVLIDEALTVGDVFFQQRCYRRLEALLARGCAVVLVSHAMGDVEQFCHEVLVLENGRTIFRGPAGEGIREYYLLEQSSRGAQPEPPSAESASAPAEPSGGLAAHAWFAPAAALDLVGAVQVSDGSARCTALAVCDAAGRPRLGFVHGETAVFYYEFELLQAVEAPVGGVNLMNSRAVLVHGRNTLQLDCDVPRGLPAGTRVRFRQEVNLNLEPGDYTFEIGLAALDAEHFGLRKQLSEAELRAATVRLCHLPAVGRLSVGLGAGARSRHYGVADLPGSCDAWVHRRDT